VVPSPSSADVAAALAHHQAGRYAEADGAIDLVLAATPTPVGALQFKGELAFRRGAPEEAAALMEQAAALGCVEPNLFRNLCEVYRTLGRLDEGLAAGLRAVAAEPSHPVGHLNLSALRYARAEIGEAIASAETAIALDPSLPGAHFSLAEPLLIRGELERGWEEYEWRYRRAGIETLMPKPDIPPWTGAYLPKGRLILLEEQGFGDAIQFSRYIPWAASRCAELVVGCGAAMAPILAQFADIASMFHRWADCPPAAAWAPLSGLPRLHGTRLGAIPSRVPYLRADAAKAAAWRSRLDALAPPGSRRIGLAWAGKPSHANDRHRSMALATLAPLGRVAGITWVSLQKGPAQPQAAAWTGPAPLVDLGPDLADFTDTMAVLDNLDLLVTVDTSVAHLAGAMARPVWIMLPRAPDWRWLEERSDSPWYPTARLFRQPALEDWTSVVDAVAEAIERRQASRP
jgi:tetratricopeptide (TPR) repeat protein